MHFDCTTFAAAFDARIATEQDEIVRRNLQVARKHIVAEVGEQLDAMMATFTPDPVFNLYNMVDGSGNISHAVISGWENVRAMYAAGCADQTLRLQELRQPRIVADRHSVVMEGDFRIGYSGASLISMGYAAEAEALYLMEGHKCAILPFTDDGRMKGEDVFFDPSGFQNILDRKIVVGWSYN